MTRNRAVKNNTPNELMADYYAQRASVGLIITEGTSPSPNGLGYARIPGLFNVAHVAGWRHVTDAVHAKGGKIFVQLMHTGRVTHVDNLPAGAEVLAPTAVAAAGEMHVDLAPFKKPHSTPRAMNESDIAKAIAEFGHSARLAVLAGFDGVEIHGANGYLVDQFLSGNVNKRTDGWGGANRNRFAIEVARAVVNAIGADRTGIRISPYGTYNDLGGAYEGGDEQYVQLIAELSKLNLLYVHHISHDAFKTQLRPLFSGLWIAVGDLDRAKAENLLENKKADLVAIGRPVLANPDYVQRIKTNAPLNQPDYAKLFTADASGYNDYPFLK